MTLPDRKRPARKSKSKRSPQAGSPKKTGFTGKPVAPGRYSTVSKPRTAREPEISCTSRIRPIGNSRGVILNNEVMASAGLNPEWDIIIQANKGVITIIQVKQAGVNTDLSTWDKQFKAAKKEGTLPDDDLFEGMNNRFDSKEW